MSVTGSVQVTRHTCYLLCLLLMLHCLQGGIRVDICKKSDQVGHQVIKDHQFWHWVCCGHRSCQFALRGHTRLFVNFHMIYD